MSQAKRWFVFIFFLSIDVRVRASNDIKERPQGCLDKQIVCALQTKESVFHLANPNFELHLGPSSIVLRNSSDEIEFVAGTLWLARYNKMTVKTVFGTVKSANGPFWIIQDKDRVWVRNVNAEVKITLRDGKELELPLGFQVWLSGLDQFGKSVVGIPETIPVESHIKLWSQLFPGTKDEFRKEVESIKWVWGSLPDKGSELYTKMADRQRQIAEAREAEILRIQSAQQQESQRVRQQFEEKTFWR